MKIQDIYTNAMFKEKYCSNLSKAPSLSHYFKNQDKIGMKLQKNPKNYRLLFKIEAKLQKNNFVNSSKNIDNYAKNRYNYI